MEILKINISDDTFSYGTPYYSRITSYLHPQRTSPDSLFGAIRGRGGKYSEEQESNWSTSGALNLWLLPRSFVTIINLSAKRRWVKITFHALDDQVTFSVGCSLPGTIKTLVQTKEDLVTIPLKPWSSTGQGLLKSNNVMGARTSFLLYGPRNTQLKSDTTK